MSTTLEAVDRRKLRGGEGVGALCSGGSIGVVRDDREDGSKDLEDSKLGSSDDMCGGK